MKNLLLRLPKWLPSILTILLILWLTLAPHPVGEIDLPLFPYADKVVHGIMFGWLSLMLIFDKWRSGKKPEISLAMTGICVAASAIFGIVIEYLQRSMELGRSFEPSDIVADTVGAIMGGLFWIIVNYIGRNERKGK